MTLPSRQTTRTRITIDGRTYESAEQMPPEVRTRYEQAMSMLADRDGNGVPDVAEGASPDLNVISHVSTSERVVVNGREYASLDDVPAEVRNLLRGQRPGAAPGGWGNGRGVSFQLSGGALLALLIVAALLGALILWIAVL